MKKILNKLYNRLVLKRMSQDGRNALESQPVIVAIMTLMSTALFGYAIDKTTAIPWWAACLFYGVIIGMINWVLIKPTTDRLAVLIRIGISLVIAVPLILLFEITLFEDEILDRLEMQSSPKLEALDNMYHAEKKRLVKDKITLMTENVRFQELLRVSSEREFHEIQTGSLGKHDTGIGDIAKRYRAMYARDSAMYVPRIAANDVRIQEIENDLDRLIELFQSDRKQILSGEVYGMLDYVEALWAKLALSSWSTWLLYIFIFLLALIVEMIVPLIKLLARKPYQEYHQIAAIVDEEQTHIAQVEAEKEQEKNLKLLKQQKAYEAEQCQLKKELEHNQAMGEIRREALYDKRQRDTEALRKESELRKKAKRDALDEDSFQTWLSKHNGTTKTRGAKPRSTK